MKNGTVEIKVETVGWLEKVCLITTTITAVAVGGLIFYDRFR